MELNILNYLILMSAITLLLKQYVKVHVILEAFNNEIFSILQNKNEKCHNSNFLKYIYTYKQKKSVQNLVIPLYSYFRFEKKIFYHKFKYN